jgi:polysaccharide biosynthesis protein PslH
MKILFICHRFPYPPNRGGKIRPFQMIRHLGRKHSVTVASLAHSEQELQEGTELSRHCDEVIAEVVASTARWSHAVAALPTARPSSSAYFWSSRLRQRILEAASRIKPDVVWVHCAFMAQYAQGIAAPLRIMDYGDLDSGKWLDYSHFRKFPLSLGYALEGRKLRRDEKRIANSFDQCTFTAPGELEEFRSWGLHKTGRLIPNGVDFDYFKRREKATEDPTIVFVGRMDYFPNVQAASEFARNVFPKIRQRVPTAQFCIVGSNPVIRVRELGAIPGVTVTGSVPDVRPHLAKAMVAIAPLRVARGTQNKILECMAVGVPVVASPQASRGVQAVAGQHMLVGDTDEKFCGQVLALFEDAHLRNQIAVAAREQLERMHCWARSMEIVDEIIGNSPRGSPEANEPSLVSSKQ